MKIHHTYSERNLYGSPYKENALLKCIFNSFLHYQLHKSSLLTPVAAEKAGYFCPSVTASEFFKPWKPSFSLVR